MLFQVFFVPELNSFRILLLPSGRPQAFPAAWPWPFKHFCPFRRIEINRIKFRFGIAIIITKLIDTYKDYVKRRGFNVYREKDENGRYKSIKEAALIYSFETYIHTIIDELEGKIYPEANTGLGKNDMIINIGNNELIVETKIYYSPGKFINGKKQLAYYCKSLGLTSGVYLVFCPTNKVNYPETVKEGTENIENIEISTYLVSYDETKWD